MPTEYIDCIWDRPFAITDKAFVEAEYSRLRSKVGYADTNRYISQLESNVATLELLLAAHAPDIARDHLHGTGRSPEEAKVHDDADDDLAKGVGMLSLSAAAEPYFIGSTSGFTLARMVHAILSNSFSATARNCIDTEVRGNSPLSSDWNDIESAEKVGLPPPQVADQLVSMFFNRIHTAYPILDKVAFFQSYSRRYDLNPNTPSDRMRLFSQHIVYAISARYFEISSTPLSTPVSSEVSLCRIARS